MKRVKPPRCPNCGVEPYECPTCGDYQCRCPLPWLMQRNKKPKIMIRVHYDRWGKPRQAKFPVQPYPAEDEDIEWLIKGGFKP